METLSLLRNYFGHTAFRPSQEDAIAHLLSGEDLLAVMPTGAGKSICYQLPALMLEGITLVISPLISLMKDQVTALVQNGIAAAYINSTLSPQQYQEVLRRGRMGRYKLIYVAPERLESESFLRFCNQVCVSMVTVDEAHCISQWGHDFRPSYLKIAGFITRLPARPIVSAFTATATNRVRSDIIQMLQLHNPHQIVTSFNRENLYFEVQRPADKDTTLLRILHTHSGSCGIIYCQTRKTVETVCAMLNTNGFSVTRYHAGLTPEERRRNQDDFLFDRKGIMVATNAFGMGIDKSNVNFVIHYNMPASMESYYQEAGRAGRDGCYADCILLYNQRDTQIARFLIQQSEPQKDQTAEMSEALQKHQLLRLSQMETYCIGTGCLRQKLLRYFGETLDTPCGNCSGCLAGYEEVDVTRDAQKLLSCIVRVERAGYQAGKQLTFLLLQGIQNETITRLGLDNLPTFGLMKNFSAGELEALTEQLAGKGLLNISQENPPVLTLSARAKPVLYGKQNVMLRKKRAVKTIHPSPKMGVDQALFDQLAQLRKRLGNRAGVPPYAIFTDKTLQELCRQKPTSIRAFQKIPGVTPVKSFVYAKDFLPVIRASGKPDTHHHKKGKGKGQELHN